MRSVTRILRAAGYGVNAFYTDDGRERGIGTHNACHALVRPDDGDHRLYLSEQEQCLEAIQTCRIAVSIVEQRLTHPTLNFTGQPDWIGTVGSRPAVIDLKRGGALPWHGYQLAGYVLLATEMESWKEASLIFDRYVLAISDTTWKLVRYSDDTDFLLFLEALYETSISA